MDSGERTEMIRGRKEERRLSHCLYEVKDSAGSYCSCLSANGVHGHTFYRTECMGIPGCMCKTGSKYIPTENGGMRLLVCGSRTYGMTKYPSSDYNSPSDAIRAMSQRSLMMRVLSYFPKYTLICGMARGADMTAHHIATPLGIHIDEYPVDWNRYGKSAGYRRNTEMLEDGVPNLILAFYDRKYSAGTQMMVRIAREGGIPVVEFGLNDEPT